jgi:hypothetical protein
MDGFDDQDDTQFDDRLDAQRQIIRASLNEIANELGMIMRDEGLRFPVYITVRNSGDSLATIATTLDPTDAEWSRASAIVCEVIEKRIGGGKLRGRELPCAVANAVPISVAEVAAE